MIAKLCYVYVFSIAFSEKRYMNSSVSRTKNSQQITVHDSALKSSVSNALLPAFSVSPSVAPVERHFLVVFRARCGGRIAGRTGGCTRHESFDL